MRLKRIGFIILMTFGITKGYCQQLENQSKIEQAISYVNANMFEQPDSALVACNQGLKLANPTSAEYALLLARRSVIYDIKGQTEKAVSGFLEAIKIQKSLHDSIELSYSYNNLGISYFYTYRYDEALEYYRLSAEIDSLQHDLAAWAGTQINRAIIFSNTNQFDQANSIYTMVLQKMESIKDSSLNGTIFSNQAKLFVLKGDYQKALDNIAKARPYILSQHDISAKMTLEVITSNAFFRSKQPDKALAAAKLGLSYDSDSVYVERRLHLYECISHAYYAKNQIDSGEFYTDLHQALRDSLFNLETQAAVEEIQVEYEVAEYKLEEERLKYVAIREAQQASEHKAERNLFLGIAAILSLIGAILFYRNRVKKAEQVILQEKLELQEQLVLQKEAFMGEIHHRVKNNLQLVASMLAIQSSQTDNQVVKSVFEASKNRIEAMSLIHEKLYQSTDFQKVELDQYLENLATQLLQAYPTEKNIELKLDLEKMTLHIDSIVPLGLILNELITNSIKYAFSSITSPKITIKIEELESLLILEFRDNGTGLPENRQKGFGSHLLASLSRQLKGKLAEQNEKGYYFRLEISKYKRI